jgi:hypothetical protein
VLAVAEERAQATRRGKLRASAHRGDTAGREKGHGRVSRETFLSGSATIPLAPRPNANS